MSSIFNVNGAVRRELGEQLWRIRRDKQLKLSSVSKITHIPFGIIDRIERGKYFSYHDYVKLAKLYDCKIKISLE